MESSIPPSRGVQRLIKPVITFDAGQTLVELDLDFLAHRLEERGVVVDPAVLGAAAPAAWRRYDALVTRGSGHPWRALMEALLEGAEIGDPGPLVEWLWTEQPRRNLWRKVIPGMLDLARELAPVASVGVLSNSEGKLAELFDEIGIARHFVAIVDSGRVGIEKPDPRIFAHALAALGGDAPGIHIGDSYAADIAGARGAGWRAIWYTPNAISSADNGIAVARDAAEAHAALVAWNILPR